MDVLRTNVVGTINPTTYEVFSRKQRETKSHFKPLVYICSAYAGDVKSNCEKARLYCRFALKRNALPLAMHLLLPQFMNDDDPKERSLAMFMNSIIQGKCSELWVFTSGVISRGMKEEIDRAKRRGQMIRWFTETCEEVSL